MIKKLNIIAFLFLAVVFCGCEPEETYVLVNASELNKAINGELGTATIEMVFEINSDDPSIPNKVRNAALPYLGPDAVIEIERTESRTVRGGGSIREYEEEVSEQTMEDGKLIARFKIPVGTRNVLRAANSSVMCLEYNPTDKMFMLVPGRSVDALNSDLSDIDYSIDFSFTGGYTTSFMNENAGVTIKINNDEAITIGVGAAKVNGDNVIFKKYNTQNGSIKINFNNSFYEGYAPCFTVGDTISEILPQKLSND